MAPQAAAKAGQFHGDRVRSARPLEDLGIPIGTASLPIEIQNSTPAAEKLSAGADNDAEVTRGDTAHVGVYALGSTSLRDITSGSDGRCGIECTAGPGYDTVTALGSPTAGVDAALAAMREHAGARSRDGLRAPVDQSGSGSVEAG
ncbi:hypothetical protein ACFY2Z_41315 [Streptomyces sp. NPDC001222]|uniref:hypothetical protein n=1 Tax=Streptomyces sp. NPDC001222 TaxID=3364548 RepID=UPI0036C3E462